MTNVIAISRAERDRESDKTCVVALHCSLGSGRQWKTLADELGRSHRFFAPDISGYGANECALDLPLTLAEEIRAISGTLNDADGPIHLVGHSYGGAIAFAIATRSAFAQRVRSLTLIEPVLPTLLCDNDADRRLHARFAQVARDVSEDIWNGSVLEAIDQFMAFWNGSGPKDPLPESVRLRMIERAHKLAFDFRRRSPRKMSQPRRPRFAFRRCCFRAGCRPMSPSASCSGLARSSTAPKSGICRPPATCSRSPMRRRSIPQSPGISPARTNSQPFRWRSKRRWRRLGRRGDFLALGAPAGLLVSVERPKPEMKCR